MTRLIPLGIKGAHPNKQPRQDATTPPRQVSCSHDTETTQIRQNAHSKGPSPAIRPAHHRLLMGTDFPRLSRSKLAGLAIATEGAMLLIALAVGWFLGISVWSQINTSWQAVAWGIAAAIPPLIIILGIAESNTKMGEMSRRDFGPVIELFRNATIFDILYVSILAGLCEEALFRAIIQVGLVSWIGLIPALILASILFGLAHAISKSYFTFATLIGIYLGALLILTDSLLAPIIAHAVYDFIALLYGTRFSKRFGHADPEHVE